MNEQKFDIIVMGAGPGGYPAAIKAAQLGKKVALVDPNDLGGTCLNRGCIPSKALISTSTLLNKIKIAKEFGIEVGPISFDYAKAVKKKDLAVKQVRGGLGNLIKKNGITLIEGFGKFVSPHQVKVFGKENVLLEAEKIIVATGSSPKEMSAFPFDQKHIIDSTSLLEMTTLPKSLLIVGGGVIGCEFASLYASFGTAVTIVEMMPRLVPMECETVSAALQEAFLKKGITLHLNTLVSQIEKGKGEITAHLSDGKLLKAECALVSVGRKMNTDGIGLEAAGVLVNSDGTITTNERMQTNVPHIFAVGDIASKWWLAHVASHQGLVAAKNACGQKAFMHYNAIPSVIFTEPEIGTCGLSLKEAIKQGYDATLSGFPFQALGKSQATGETEGFAQIVTDKKTQAILGAQVVGHDAGVLVAEMALAIGNELTVESITETIHAHPTVTEVWMEAALIANNTPLHWPPKRKASDV